VLVGKVTPEGENPAERAEEKLLRANFPVRRASGREGYGRWARAVRA